MKQTAVEWLEDKIQSDMTFMEILGLINQAKAMEREQICQAYIYGAAYGIDISNNLSPDIYYNETFKSE